MTRSNAIVVGAFALIAWGVVLSLGESQNAPPSYPAAQATPSPEHDSTPSAYVDPDEPEDSYKQFGVYDCTQDCSGHEAGYEWAERNGISDGDDCDTAGEHSNSPSFAEGCHAYVDGDPETNPSDDDSDSQGDDN